MKSWLSAHNIRLADTTNYFPNALSTCDSFMLHFDSSKTPNWALWLACSWRNTSYIQRLMFDKGRNKLFFLCWKNSKSELIRPSSLSVRVSTMMVMMMIVEARVNFFFWIICSMFPTALALELGLMIKTTHSAREFLFNVFFSSTYIFPPIHSCSIILVHTSHLCLVFFFLFFL